MKHIEIKILIAVLFIISFFSCMFNHSYIKEIKELRAELYYLHEECLENRYGGWTTEEEHLDHLTGEYTGKKKFEIFRNPERNRR